MLLPGNCARFINCTEIAVAYFLLITVIWVDAIPIDNRLVGQEIEKECIANRAVDLAIVLDSSTSTKSAFGDQKRFVNSILDQLGSNFAFNGVRIGIVQFSDNPQLELELGQSDSKFRIQRTISRIRAMGGATYTGAALNFTLNRLFDQARGNGVPKVLLIITDGRSQDDVKSVAEALKHEDILVYAIGVTKAVNINELYTIAGTPKRAFTVDNFRDLDEPFSKMIVKEMCKTNFQPGLPEIICSSDSIGVAAQTKNPFEGHVFVQDYFHIDGCRKESYNFKNPKSVGISIPFSKCGVRRIRSLNPPGIFVETTIIFMFHPFFMTKVDQAIKVQCFYMEAGKTVDTPIQVSMISTEFASQIYRMPTCIYSLQTTQGFPVKYAKIGAKVIHTWECQEYDISYDIYGMVVHDCYVDDGQGDRVDLVDERGCSLDMHLIPTPVYDRSLRLAQASSHVFKYADRLILQFHCEITICYKNDGGCDGITPPECSDRTSQTRRFLRNKRSTSNSSAEKIITKNTENLVEVSSSILQVLDQYADVIAVEERQCLIQTWKILLVTLVCVFTVICSLMIMIILSYKFRNSG